MQADQRHAVPEAAAVAPRTLRAARPASDAPAAGTALRVRRLEARQGQRRLPRGRRRPLLLRAGGPGPPAGRRAPHRTHPRSAAQGRAGRGARPQLREGRLQHLPGPPPEVPPGTGRVDAGAHAGLGRQDGTLHGTRGRQPAGRTAPSAGALPRLPGHRAAGRPCGRGAHGGRRPAGAALRAGELPQHRAHPEGEGRPAPAGGHGRPHGARAARARQRARRLLLPHVGLPGGRGGDEC